MKPLDDPEVSAWHRLADDGLRIVRLALEQPVPILGPACFHAQQAAEKELKALLVALGADVPRTHDVVLLVRILAEFIPEALELRDPAAVISAYGVSPRYPALGTATTLVEAAEALAKAEHVRTWTRARWETGEARAHDESRG